MSPHDVIERARRRAGDDRLHVPRCECVNDCDLPHITGRCHRVKDQPIIDRTGRAVRVDLTVVTRSDDGAPIAACQDCAAGIEERGGDV